MSTVSFVNVNKIYDNNVQAVFDFNLEVADKEFIVLVGPSGCGKSTTLRMLAGLEEISSGTIAMVFQNYALYPHMTVYDNMAFALKIKHVDSATIDERVLQTAKILDLTPYLKRKPKALSGGQRQRVALGRAIVRTPKVFLMDEPLSNLDAKLRVQMRSEISKIHQKVGATTVYVTHDQTEAMTMADRIVIMKDGYIQQIGTPKEVYSLPHNMFVGGFIGSPAMNFIEGTFNGKEFVVTNKENAEEGTKVKVPENFVKLLDKYRSQKIEELKAVIEEEKNAEANENDAPEQKLSKKNVAIREENISRRKASIEKHETLLAQLESGTYPVVFGVRPEDVKIVSGKTAPITTLKCDISELLGRDSIVYTYIDGQRLIVQTEADNEVSEGQSFGIDFNFKKCHFFDVESTVRIRE